MDELKPLPAHLANYATGALESKINGSVTRAILAAYPQAWVRKTFSGSHGSSGVGDLLVCAFGRFISLEVKTPEAFTRRGHNLTQMQGYVGRYIIRAGGVWSIVTSAAEALLVLEQAQNGDAWQERSIDILREREHVTRDRVRDKKRKVRKSASSRLRKRRAQERKNPLLFEGLLDITGTTPETRRTLET